MLAVVAAGLDDGSIGLAVNDIVGYQVDGIRLGIDTTPGSNIDNNEAVSKLLTYDRWFFHVEDSAKQFNLFFAGDRLVKIDYRNYYMELP
ncbi:MAG: hypothetical protein GY947_06920 [Rhodobacteraceae bacterium]|nr:hypothetical protein [Paracoccaceae bacterium]